MTVGEELQEFVETMVREVVDESDKVRSNLLESASTVVVDSPHRGIHQAREEGHPAGDGPLTDVRPTSPPRLGFLIGVGSQEITSSAHAIDGWSALRPWEAKMERRVTVCFLIILLSAGCLGVDTEISESPTVAAFDPAPVSPDEDHLKLPQIPQPSDLLLDPASGRVSIPVESQLQVLGGDPVTVQNFGTETVAELMVSHFNTLYGFPTSGGTATALVGAEIMAESVTSETAYILDVTDLGEAGAVRVDGVEPILGASKQTDAGFSTSLTFLPPAGGWEQGRIYAAVVTSGIFDAEGKPLRASYVYNFVKSTAALALDGQTVCALPDMTAIQLEGLRVFLVPVFEHLESVGVDGEKVDRGDIAQLWTFTIRPGAIVRYDLLNQIFPTPNDVLLTGPASTPFDCDEDGEADCLPGHLCFPVDCEAGFENASNTFFAYMNSLDGWPAGLLPSVLFTLPIDPATVTGDTIQVHDLGTGAPLEGTSWSWDEGTMALTIIPGGVAAGGHYAVSVGRGIQNAGGGYPVSPDDTMGVLKLTRPLVDEAGNSLIAELGLAGGDQDAEDALAGLLEVMRLQVDALLKATGLDGARQDVAAIWSYGIHTGNEAFFDPIGGVIPFPNDLLMTLDAAGNPDLVAIPVPDDPVMAPVVEAMNTLDGFSTLTPTRAGFLRPLDTTNFRALAEATELLDPTLAGSTVALVGIDPVVDLTSGEIELLTLVVNGQLDVLGDTRVEVTFSNGQLEIRPRPGHPLKPGWRYVVAVLEATRSLEEGPDGEPYPIQVSPIFFLARSPYPLYDAEADASLLPALLDAPTAALLEQLRSNYDMFFSGLEDAANLDRSKIHLFWTFTTQRVSAWVKDLRSSMAGLTVPGEVTVTLKTPAAYGYENMDAVAQLGTDGRFGGVTALALPDLSDPAAPASRLQFNDDGVPQWLATEIPFSLAIPHGDGPFRVVIVQHGLMGRRADFLSVANHFAAADYIVIAMDLPLHGDRAVDGADSGAGFFNADAVSVRDNLVTSALDLGQLVRFIQASTGLDSLLPSSVTLDADKVYYVGESLGGIVGALFLGVEPAVEAAALVSMGGHLTRILEETQNEGFSQPITDTLTALGLEKGTPGYVQFMESAQMLLDRGDPVNYAVEYGTQGDPPKVMLLTAGDEVGDGFMPWGATMEFACAARHGDYPYTFHYEGTCGGEADEGACHGFFLQPEGDPALAQDAWDKVLAFFDSDGVPGDEVGLNPGTALDCSFGN